ncbi:sodium-dependent transporter [Novosphingopyxis sp. YJ-S2-01]|uniref:sodium-dependent transporter n=1 Tax=Novosphingopyxis sp. YJ-S2-01 TaxID=2794021 RepID=UPI0018DC446A|nr:sodium-dependent transporter [Novosphingopyxis sp. YJ-S2-01]MBH9538414.1 sodium-dependent transporter [Novosphingopyxis sp. YJ-S2-01]
MAAAAGKQTTEGWSSRWGFILAATGSAVGLGNLWRFPSEAGTNGGGAFVIFYIFCVVLIGLPVLLSETLIGRHGKADAIESTKTVARDSGASTAWSALAGIGMLGAFLILTFYSVIAGWVIYYIGLFAGDVATSIGNGALLGGAFQGESLEQVQGYLPALFADNGLMIGLHALFMAVTVFVIARGVGGGIEKIAVYLMPTFFILLIGITLYSLATGAAGEAFAFLFAFDPSRLLHGNVMLSALGQAFFSLSLGSAMMITYGAYADRKTNLASTSAIIAAADTSVAIIAGLAIFPIVFAAGLASDSGPTLMFQVLPASFQTMPAGSFIGLLFFVMVLFAALTSSVALLEAPTAWVMKRLGLPRAVTAIGLGILAFAIGILSAMSFNSLENWHPLNFSIFEGQNFFSIVDIFTGKILLPLSAFLVSVFVGWIADKRLTDDENGISGGLHLTWRFLIAWLCPIAVGAILVFGLIS